MSATFKSFEAWLASDDSGAQVARMLTAGNEDALKAARVAWYSSAVNTCLINSEAVSAAFDKAAGRAVTAGAAK